MKIFFIVLGFIALGLGCIGIALPILPTTPLLLLAAFCFAKSSERLNNWFKSTKIYQDNLESFVKGQGMPWPAKLRIMGTVTLLMAIGFILMKDVPVGRICMAAVWVAHVIAFCFIIKSPERAKEEAAAHDDQ